MLHKITVIIKSIIKKRNLNNMKKSIVNSNRNVLEIKNVYDARKLDFSLSESQIYNFPKNDYREYITTWEAYQPRLTNTKYFNISDDKLLFSTVMKNYADVPEVYALINQGNVHSVSEKDFTVESLYDFFIENNGGVIKARGGFNGFNVYVFYCENGVLTRNNEEVSREQFFEIINRIPNALVQKRMIQGEFENAIFDKAINTIRIITMKKKDSLEHEVVAALQRMGTSKTNSVDNFAQGGGSSIIDIDTGKMSAITFMDSFDENGNRVFYSKHPDSGTQIEGVVIPHWKEIKEQIIDITRRLPLFDYIAWDIVLKDDGISIIETNMKSSLDLFQAHGGMRNQFLGKKYKERGYIK